MKRSTLIRIHVVTLGLAIIVLALLTSLKAEAGLGTVNLTELRTVDGKDYPVCQFEDCSDQPGQVGLWLDKDTGNWWLSLGDKSYLVVDDTVTGPDPVVLWAI